MRYLTDPERNQSPGLVSRRSFFSTVVDGLHGAALGYLLGQDLFASNPVVATGPYDLKPRLAHHASKARAMIQLFMNGGPSQVDLFDPKPALKKYAGQQPGRDLASEVR